MPRAWWIWVGLVGASGSMTACSGFHAAAPGDGGSSAFTVVQEIPDAGSLNAIWGSGASDVHTVGDNGLILEWDGHQWLSVLGITGAKLGGVWGSSATDVYAVGTLAADGRGLVEHNDGSGWTEEIEVPTGLVSIWGVDDLRLAGGLDGTVYKKTATRDWYQLVTLAKNPYVADSANSPILFSIWGNNATMVLVAADLDMTVNFVGSSMWVPLYDPVDRTRAYRAVWGPPSADPQLFVGANYYGVWDFTGKDQALVALNEEHVTADDQQHFIWGVYGLSADRVIVVGSAGRIMTWDGGPDGLKTVASPTSRDLFGVWASSPDDVWIVGDGALILHGKVQF